MNEAEVRGLMVMHACARARACVSLCAKAPLAMSARLNNVKQTQSNDAKACPRAKTWHTTISRTKHSRGHFLCSTAHKSRTSRSRFLCSTAQKSRTGRSRFLCRAGQKWRRGRLRFMWSTAQKSRTQKAPGQDREGAKPPDSNCARSERRPYARPMRRLSLPGPRSPQKPNTSCGQSRAHSAGRRWARGGGGHPNSKANPSNGIIPVDDDVGPERFGCSRRSSTSHRSACCRCSVVCASRSAQWQRWLASETPRLRVSGRVLPTPLGTAGCTSMLGARKSDVSKQYNVLVSGRELKSRARV